MARWPWRLVRLAAKRSDDRMAVVAVVVVVVVVVTAKFTLNRIARMT